MADSKVFMLPDSFSGNSLDPNLLYTTMMNNNGFGGNGGWIWMLFLWMIFGWVYGGYGNGFGGQNGAAGFLSNQLNNDAGRELLMNAIQGNGNAINQLSTLLNTEVQTVQNGIFTLNNAITSVGS